VRVRELISVWVLGVGVRSRVGRVGTQSAVEEEGLCTGHRFADGTRLHNLCHLESSRHTCGSSATRRQSMKSTCLGHGFVSRRGSQDLQQMPLNYLRKALAAHGVGAEHARLWQTVGRFWRRHGLVLSGESREPGYRVRDWK
jgi:hypothetical protein